MSMSASIPKPSERRLRHAELRGGVADLWNSRDAEVILSGPAGTGKSRGALEKIHRFLSRYPGSKYLVVRKTAVSLASSALATYREQVINKPGDPPVTFFGGNWQEPPSYRYPNGSLLVPAGLDRASKALSTEYDGIYVQQAEETTLGDWETLNTRLRARDVSSGAPYQQLIGDCNPDAPTHWIYRRAQSGELRLIESRHEDNPGMWDLRTGDWTAAGRLYIGRLDALSGVRRQRLRYGRWVGAEGVVYEDWDRNTHLIDRFEVPRSWRRFRSIDFGFVNPFVCFDDQTEILTKSGWKSFEGLTRGEPVAAISPATKALQWEIPTSYIRQRYDGQMVTSEPSEQGANFSVTPNHNMVVANRRSKAWRLEKASRLGTLGNSAIPTGWNPIEDPPTPEGDLAYARFIGLVLSEGCLYKQRVASTGETRYFVRIAQKRDPDAVRSILQRCGYHWTEYKAANGVIDFRIQSAALYRALAGEGMDVSSRDKRIPRFALDWSAGALEALLSGLMLGDGRHRTHDESGRRVASDTYFTTSRGLADDVQSLLCRLGRASVIRAKTCKTPFCPEGTTLYTVTAHVAEQALIRKLPIKETDYHGWVSCVTVPSGMIVVRRGGRPMVCGNCQWWAMDPDGALYLYREIYQTQTLTSDHADRINALSQGERIEATVADHDAGDRATLKAKGIVTIPAKKTVSVGIQEVQSRLRKQRDGAPRLYILRDSLAQRDEELHAGRRPVNTEQEFDSYVWPKTAEGKPQKEEPVKDDDHGMDALRYLCMHLPLNRRIGVPRGAAGGERTALDNYRPR